MGQGQHRRATRIDVLRRETQRLNPARSSNSNQVELLPHWGAPRRAPDGKHAEARKAFFSETGSGNFRVVAKYNDLETLRRSGM